MTTKKTKEIKARIKTERENLQTLLDSITPELINEELNLEEKERLEKQQGRKDELAKYRANLVALNEELFLAKMNKNDSPAFQWIPHKGMNRRQARAFAKQRAKENGKHKRPISKTSRD